MKIDYKVLWIDDKIGNRPFQSIINEIKNFLQNEYFDCKINTAEDFSSFKEIFDTNNEYDIIITDYSLNENSTGNQIIDYIRDNQHNFTEIFFYSANSDVKNIDLINKNRITYYQLVEGNYKELEKEVQEVIFQTIKKFHHIVSMRGMIMNETSNLDVEMMELLIKIVNQNGIEKVIPIIKEKYKQSVLDINKTIEDEEEVSVVLHKIGSEHRWRAISRNIPKGDLKTVFESYKKEIIDERNRFAHAVLIEESGRTFFRHKENGIDFNEDKCREIRKNILKHKQNIEKMKKQF